MANLVDSPAIDPARRYALSPDMTLVPRDGGEWFVRHQGQRRFFRLGAEEHALLTGMAGGLSADELREEYRRRFDDELTPEEVQAFRQSAVEQGLLVSGLAAAPTPRRRVLGSLMHFRVPLWDPDRFLSALISHIGFFWSRGAAAVYALLGLLAAHGNVVVGGVTPPKAENGTADERS